MPLPKNFQVDSMYQIEGGIHIFNNFLNKWNTYLLNECPQGPKIVLEIDYEPLNNLKKIWPNRMYKTDHRCVHIFGPNITTCGGAHDILMSAPMGQKVLRSGYNPCSKIFRPLGELIERLLVSLIWKISKFVYTSFFNFVHGINLKNLGKRHWAPQKNFPF